MSKVRIGIIQMKIETSQFGKKHKARNLAEAEKLIKKLFQEEENIDIVILPDEFISAGGYNFTNIPYEKRDIEDNVLKNFKDIAKEKKCYIISSIIFNDKNSSSSDKRYEDLGFIIDRNGEILGYQGKFNLFDDEKEYIKPSNEYNIFDLDVGKVGMVLSNDIMYPEISRNMVLKGADIIISPSLIVKMNDKDKEEENKLIENITRQSVIAAAMQNQVFVIYVNGLGKSIHCNGNFVGKSLVVSPLGNIESFNDSECIKVVEIDTEEINTAKNIISVMEIRNEEACKISE